MDKLFLLVLLGLTSLGASLIGARWLGLSWGQLRPAVGRMLESLGISLIFFVVNLAAGVVTILAARTLTPWFISLYLVDDVALLVLSLLQGLTFQWWRESSVRR